MALIVTTAKTSTRAMIGGVIGLMAGLFATFAWAPAAGMAGPSWMLSVPISLGFALLMAWFFAVFSLHEQPGAQAGGKTRETSQELDSETPHDRHTAAA